MFKNVTYKHRVAGDSVTDKIDRFYDGIDSGIDALKKVFGSTKQVRGDDALPSAPPVIEARPAKQLGCAPAGAKFRIIESTDAETGVDTFVVTNGKVKAELPSRQLAEQVLAAMEAAAK